MNAQNAIDHQIERARHDKKLLKKILLLKILECGMRGKPISKLMEQMGGMTYRSFLRYHFTPLAVEICNYNNKTHRLDLPTNWASSSATRAFQFTKEQEKNMLKIVQLYIEHLLSGLESTTTGTK